MSGAGSYSPMAPWSSLHSRGGRKVKLRKARKGNILLENGREYKFRGDWVRCDRKPAGLQQKAPLLELSLPANQSTRCIRQTASSFFAGKPGSNWPYETRGSELARESIIPTAEDVSSLRPIREQARSHGFGSSITFATIKKNPNTRSGFFHAATQPINAISGSGTDGYGRFVDCRRNRLERLAQRFHPYP